MSPHNQILARFNVPYNRPLTQLEAAYTINLMAEHIVTLYLDRAVAAIRADKKVGRGTCTSIDEAYSDAELTQYIRDDYEGPIADTACIIKWARNDEGVRQAN